MWLVNNARPFTSCENDNDCDENNNNNSTETNSTMTASSIRKISFINDTQSTGKTLIANRQFQFDQLNLSSATTKSRSTQATIVTSIILLMLYSGMAVIYKYNII